MRKRGREWILRLRLIVCIACGSVLENLRTYRTTRRRRFSFLAGKMDVFFLGGLFPDFAPLIFGEAFWMIRYDGWLIDPGGPRMVTSVARHLDDLNTHAVRGVLATHGHEEHAGNLAFVSRRLGVPVWAHPAVEETMRRPPRLPFIRRLVIGQPTPFQGPTERLAGGLRSALATLEVVATPGHCDDHLALYDRAEKLLLAGDAFVSATFTAPNADVDSVEWLATLRRFATLDVEVLVTGHGKIYTLREEFPDFPGVVVRQHPQLCIAEKIRFLERHKATVEAGLDLGLPPRAIERRMFPWSEPWTARNFFFDTAAAWLSGGEFSRAEFLRSFLRTRRHQ